MQTVITIQGAVVPTNDRAPWNFETNQGRFKVWPLIGEDPNPIVEMFRNGIGQSFDVTYTEKPWTNPKSGKTFQQRYVDSAEYATGGQANVPNVQANSMQTAAQASPAVVAPVQGGFTAQPASAPPAPIQDDIRHNQAAMIFVTGVVGRSMQSAEFGPGDIWRLTECALAAWRGIPEMGQQQPAAQPVPQGNEPPLPEERG